MKKINLKKLLSLCAGFALALVAVVTFGAYGKNLTAQAEETSQTLATQVTTTLGTHDVIGGYKYKEVTTGETIGKNTRFYIRVSAGGVNTMTYWYSDNYAIFFDGTGIKIAQFEESGNSYGSMSEVASATKITTEQITDGITEKTLYAFDMLVDFGEVKGIGDYNLSSIYLETGENFTTSVETSVTYEDLQNEEKYTHVTVGDDIIKQGSRVYVYVVSTGSNAPTYFYSDYFAIYNYNGLRVKKFKNVGVEMSAASDISETGGDAELLVAEPQVDTVYAFDMLVDFGKIKAISPIGEYFKLYVGTATPDDGTTTPDDGTTTPDDGTTTPDDGTTTPDDGTTEEPKQDTTDKLSDWLNSTFGLRTTGSLVGSIALLLSGVFIIKAIFGKK